MSNQALPQWRETSLGDLADVVGGGTPPRENPDFFGNYIDWVTPTDLAPIGTVTALGTVAEGLSEEGLAKSSAKPLPPGSVLFSSRASIGKIAVTDRTCATNQGFANLVPREGVDPWFLAYLLCHNIPAIVRLAGETTYKEVSRKNLKAFRLDVPPLDEQRRIVARIRECLECVDEIRALTAEALREHEALFAAALGDVERAASWPRVPIGELVTTRNGRSIRSTGDDGNGYVLTLSAVRDVSVDFTKRKRVEVDEKTAETFRVRAGDVFVSRSNTRELVGLSAVAETAPEERVIFPDLLIRLTPKDSRVTSRYLAYALRFPSVRDQIMAHAKGTSQSMVKISAGSLGKVVVPLPPREQQEDLLVKLEEAWRVSSLLADAFASNDPSVLSQAILRKAFAGEF
jgi:type I restriction enzyme S subunit